MSLYDEAEIQARSEASKRGFPNMAPMQPKATVRLKGAKHDPRFHIRDNRMLGMVGRTEVDADFWAAWTKQNSSYSPLRAGLIFAERTGARAQDAIRERSDERTGYEGLDPENLPVVGVTQREEDG
ncbi:hypothetical protein HUK84_00875 [Nguyenibacter vanlangensis]|uniref:Uncharacterized protein n=1 Tax=Nguyenibacter vanlangensis TaxID=1216886 RepID=A0A7Y7M3H6_9PROT|nr:hypothetical protein [Nguyenibacter vanlangensis]